MSESIGTVGMLLGLDDKAASDRRIDPAELAELGKRVAGALRGSLPAMHLPRASLETLAALAGMLGAPVVKCLTEAWNKRAEFRKFADPLQYPPDKIASVTLYPHTVKWTYRPSVEILLNGRSVTKLPFVVDLEFKLDGAELLVQGGKLRRLRTGRTTITGKLNFHGVMLHTRTLDQHTLPGVVEFGDGVAIPGISAPVSSPASLPAPSSRPTEVRAELR